MKNITLSSIVIIGILLLFLAASGCITTQDDPKLEPVSEEYYAEMDAALYPYMQSVDEQMKDITASVWNAARELDGVPKKGQAVNLALLKLKSEIPLAYDVERIDEHNILTAIAGELNTSLQVGDEIITNQYTEEDFRAAGSQCIVSTFTEFQTGNQGIKVSAPIYDAEGNFDGTLQVILDGTYLFSGPAEELRTTYGYTVWVAQENGVVIYDEDAYEIGSNLLEPNAAYTPSFMAAANDILENESGHTSYIFYTIDWHKISQTNAVWSTLVPGYGPTWRVILIDNVPPRHELIEPSVTPEELKAFVMNAYVYAQTKGKTAALAAFNDPNGEFIDGELYIFAFETDGTILGLPYQPVLIGTNSWFAEDPSGVKYVQRMIARAQQGGGYVLYLAPNPSAGYSTELKLSYVIPIDNQWFIGAGLYEHTAPISHTVSVDWQTRNELIKQVRTMRYLAAVEGIPAVTEMIMDPTSSFQREGLYPFAITGNGTILAFANNPAIVGTNQLGTLNSYGMSFAREGISLGKSGGGLMYTLAWDSGKQKEVFVLDYVEPAGNDTYFASYMILE